MDMLVPIDDDHASLTALDFALTTAVPAIDNLHIAHITTRTTNASDLLDRAAARITAADTTIDTSLSAYTPHDLDCAQDASISRLLIELAHRRNCEHIILGRPDTTSLSATGDGRVMRRFIDHRDYPITLVAPDTLMSGNTLAVAIDDRAASTAALEFAARRAATRDAQLHIIHIHTGSNPDPGIQHTIDSTLADTAPNLPTTISYHTTGDRASGTAVGNTLLDLLRDNRPAYTQLVLGNEPTGIVRKVTAGSATQTTVNAGDFPVTLVPANPHTPSR